MQRSSPARPSSLSRSLSLWPAVLATVAGLALVAPSGAQAAETPATAWQNGAFQLDTAGVVSRSNIVLGAPNNDPIASMPMGNGSLGVSAWAADGFTAQLNRSDTLPNRKSPGQVNIPGLSVISRAADYKGVLDLTDGVLRQSGGGVSMKAWVAGAKDELIIDVSGANPDVAQSATINLWSGRKPAAAVSGTVGTLAETWPDTAPPSGTGKTFGSLAAVTAAGREVKTTVASPTQVKVAFKPHADGSFRVVVASPAWKGGDAAKTASAVIGSDATAATSALMANQDAWWNRFWKNSGLIAMASSDGSAQYMENLRTLYLYAEAASMRKGVNPGSQAGEADMFAWNKDKQTWTPSSFWLWNLRTQISANMSSGNYALNTPIFDMYADNLSAIETWTKAQMGGLPGACVPEVMRFNGNGGDPAAGANAACSAPGAPNWNALNISSGPEIALYMWQQFKATNDVATLKKYFPFMKSTAVFQLAYQKPGDDGLLHSTANAHETQWDVKDPTTNIAAARALFPVIQQAAAVLGTAKTTDAALVAQVAKAEKQIPPYPRTDAATRTKLLNPNYTKAETDAADKTGSDMIAVSYEPTAQRRNSENVELEPLWPWNTVTDQDTNLFEVEKRSYAHRPVTTGNDWSMDAIQAARLQNPSEVRDRLISITKAHQVYPNGFADIGDKVGYQPYIEQMSGVATAVNEALAQDFDGILRFAPAWPADWDVSGTVYLQQKNKADVQVQDGQLATAAIEAGSTGTVKVKSPWPGKQVEVVDGKTGKPVVQAGTAGLFSVPVKAGSTYLVQQVSAPTMDRPFARVTGSAPTAARHLGGVQIGLDAGVKSGTATVGTTLAASNRSYGLTQFDYAGSSGARTTAGVVGGHSARTTGAGTGGTGSDMYFDVGNGTAATGAYDAELTLSYYDSAAGSIAVQYDAGPQDRYHSAGTIALNGSRTWKTARIDLKKAYFGGLQNAGADLRLHSANPFSVHSAGLAVTGPWVVDSHPFPPTPALTTPASEATVKLASAFSGTAVPDGAVSVRKGSNTLCDTAADSGGSWSCSPSGGLTRGRQTVTVSATDLGGLQSLPSPGLTFTASDQPPGTSVVGAVLGSDNHAYGLTQAEDTSGGFDGPTTASVIGGVTARTGTAGNIYFDIDDSVASAGYYTASVTVSFYDQGSGSFAVQYDDGSSNPYKSTAAVPLTGTNTWKTATVRAPDAYFGSSQHAKGDFRLRNGGGKVTVHSIAVEISGDGVPDARRFAPPVKIASPVADTTVGTSPTVSGTAEPDAKVTVAVEGTAMCSTTVGHDGTWTCTATTPLAAGARTLTAIAKDLTGTDADEATVRVRVG